MGDNRLALGATALAIVGTSDQLEAGFTRLHDLIPTMTDEELLTVFHRSATLAKQAWLIQSHILAEAKRRKEHHNDGGVRAAARMFDISPSNASGFIRIWETYEQDFLNQRAPFDHLIGVSWYKTAAYSPKPQEWLEEAARKKAQNPRYSIRDFKADIERDRVYRAARPDDEAPAPAPAQAPAGPETTVLSREEAERELAAPTLLATRRGLPAPATTAADDKQARVYLSAVSVMAAALDGAEDMLYHADPDELAARLQPMTDDDALDQDLLLKAFAFFGRVFALRTARRAAGQRQPRRAGRDTTGAASA